MYHRPLLLVINPKTGMVQRYSGSLKSGIAVIEEYWRLGEMTLELDRFRKFGPDAFPDNVA